MCQKWPPLGPSKPPKTTKKLEKDPSKNKLKKNNVKTMENKPVLAWEREARLKELKGKASHDHNPNIT